RHRTAVSVIFPFFFVACLALSAAILIHERFHPLEMIAGVGTVAYAQVGTPLAVEPATSFAEQAFALARPTAVNGILYFAADDGITGQEPWQFDSLTGETKQVSNIRSLPEGSSAPAELTNYNGRMVFSADQGGALGTGLGRQLWILDPGT